MTNSIELLFYQDLVDNGNHERYKMDFSRTTNDEFNPHFLKLLATYELFRWLKLATGVNIKTFNLRKTIFVDVFWNNNLVLNLVQVKVTKDRILRKGIDYSYKIKATRYLLVNSKEIKSKKERVEFTNPKIIDLNKYFNTIDNKIGKPTRYTSPILYTGMTN